MSRSTTGAGRCGQKWAKRWVPLFPYLRSHLEALWDAAEPGTVHVNNRYRDSEQNLRTTLEKVIHRAGLLPWERLFQNMRASRETELTQDYPLHVVVAWIGNSELVAAQHYLQITDADFDHAVRGGAKRGAVSVCRETPRVERPAGNAIATGG